MNFFDFRKETEESKKILEGPGNIRKNADLVYGYFHSSNAMCGRELDLQVKCQHGSGHMHHDRASEAGTVRCCAIGYPLWRGHCGLFVDRCEQKFHV